MSEKEVCPDWEYDESGLGKLGYSGCQICWKQGRKECPKKKRGVRCRLTDARSAGESRK